MKIKLNKTYNFAYRGKVSFGDLSEEECHEVLQDGRFAAPFMERQLTKHFPELVHVDKPGYDHVDPTGQRYDAKNFTKRGLKFMPSNQIGQGREFDKEVAHEKSSDLIYICCDIVEFPKVRVIFKKGSDLIQEYPSCTINKSKREVLFG